MKKWAYVLGILLLGGVVYSQTPQDDINDYWTIKGRGTENNVAVIFVDNNKNLNLRTGDIYLGVSGSTPSFTAGTYPSLKIPFINKSSSAMAQGTVVIASVTALTQTAWGTQTNVVNSTTTVLGVCEGFLSVGGFGWVSISGYTLALTTGPVKVGDMLVSTTGSNGVGAAGYAGVAPSSGAPFGAAVGIAVSSGNPAGGLTLIRLR